MKKVIKWLLILAIIAGAAFGGYKLYHYMIAYATKKITKGVTQGVTTGVAREMVGDVVEGVGKAFKGKI